MIIYRITDIPSTNPSPVFQEDKKALNRLCLRSFVKGFEDVNPFVNFILDHGSDETQKMIEKECPFSLSIYKTELGINETMNMSYELACKADENVLFQECDYIYTPRIGKTFFKAVDELKLVSPYDHLNFYKDQSIHSRTADLFLVDGHHFRTTERNTMTWGCHSSLVKENKEMLMKYGYLDDEVWKELAYAGYFLHVPIPSFATHMVSEWMAPSVNWEEVWKENL